VHCSKTSGVAEARHKSRVVRVPSTSTKEEKGE